MAINENPSLPNRHCGYIATSGAGKSQALKQNPDIPRRGVRLVAWDPNRDHKNHCTLFEAHEFHAFGKALQDGMRSGAGFRLGFVGPQDDWKFFDRQFCRLVWAMLDGNRPTYVLLEELAAVQPSSGKAPPNCGVLFNQARKYHGMLHWTTQKPTDVSQTALMQSEYFYIGKPGKFCSDTRADQLARIAEVPGGRKGLQQLQPMEFFRVTPTESRLVKIKYKNL